MSTKPELAALGKVFEREINRAFDRSLPLINSKAKVYQKLAADQMLMRSHFEDGWELTHLGRMTYCASCEDPGTPD